MGTFMGIVLLLVILFVGYKIIKNKIALNKLKRKSLIFFGFRGKGKDLLFQYLVNSLVPVKRPIFSNISYGERTVNFDPIELSIAPNTVERFIDDDITLIKKKEKFENSVCIISDGSLYFGNWAEKSLLKKYPDFPLMVALFRHLYNGDMLINTQDLDRLWRVIEEQQDGYVWCRQVKKIPFLGLIGQGVYYEKFSSAEQRLLPMHKVGLHNNYNRSDVEQYKATNGDISTFWYFVPFWKIKYNTRAFHDKIFGEPAPVKKKKEKVKKVKKEKIKVVKNG